MLGKEKTNSQLGGLLDIRYHGVGTTLNGFNRVISLYDRKSMDGPPCVTCYMSRITCHMSHVMCHVSLVKCHVTFVT